ncbi:hypothetical protein FOA52_005489 [Chlamydomonas sp. UWO 241]|nr:hypothetical protein FOA52_005489 [Chlamydomonas sp. UWO 241]
MGSYITFGGAPPSCASLSRFLLSEGVDDAFGHWSRAEAEAAAVPAAGARAAGLAAAPAAGVRAGLAARALRSVLDSGLRDLLSEMFEKHNSGIHNLDYLASDFMEEAGLRRERFTDQG